MFREDHVQKFAYISENSQIERVVETQYSGSALCTDCDALKHGDARKCIAECSMMLRSERRHAMSLVHDLVWAHIATHQVLVWISVEVFPATFLPPSPFLSFLQNRKGDGQRVFHDRMRHWLSM